jgi:hypothetical protein
MHNRGQRSLYKPTAACQLTAGLRHGPLCVVLAATIPESSPPPALKLLGDKFVTADGGKEVNIHGINW